MKNILITNDDGIESEGLIRLARAAQAYGTVWVVAPDSQRSAASRAITIRTPIDLRPCAFPVPWVRAYSCSGTPADCVRTGMLYLMAARPDVVLAGINNGYNVGSDVPYSGTAGAAFEAAARGVPAIALSEGSGEDHAVTDACLDQLLQELLETRLKPGEICSVNFPQIPMESFRGILRDRSLSASSPYQARYRALELLGDGGVRLTADGLFTTDAEPGSDYRALVDGCVSVSILRDIR